MMDDDDDDVDDDGGDDHTTMTTARRRTRNTSHQCTMYSESRGYCKATAAPLLNSRKISSMIKQRWPHEKKSHFSKSPNRSTKRPLSFAMRQ